MRQPSSSSAFSGTPTLRHGNFVEQEDADRESDSLMGTDSMLVLSRRDRLPNGGREVALLEVENMLGSEHERSGTICPSIEGTLMRCPLEAGVCCTDADVCCPSGSALCWRTPSATSLLMLRFALPCSVTCLNSRAKC